MGFEWSKESEKPRRQLASVAMRSEGSPKILELKTLTPRKRGSE